MKADCNIKINGVWYKAGDELPEEKAVDPVVAPEPAPEPEPEPEPVEEPASAEKQEEKPKAVRTSSNRRKANAAK